jgi:hypothetical protein
LSAARRKKAVPQTSSGRSKADTRRQAPSQRRKDDIPRSSADILGKERFAWSAAHISECGDAPGSSWALEAPQAHRVIRLLEDLGARTWADVHQIVIDGHRAHHSQEVAELAENQLRTWLLDNQIERAFRLRVSPIERIWGFVHRQVFHLVWFDADHSVYRLAGRGDKRKQRR